MANGDLGPLIDNLNFGTPGFAPSLVHVSGDIYAVAYLDGAAIGRVRTFTIDSSGVVGGATIDSYNFGTSTSDPYILNIAGDVFAVAYRGVDGDGWLVSFTIDAAGNIGVANIDTLEFDPVNCWYVDFHLISGSVYLLAYRNSAAGVVRLVTVTINDNGTFGIIDTADIPIAPANTNPVRAINVSGDVWAISFTRATDNHGILVTLSISDAGAISGILNTSDWSNDAEYVSIALAISGIYVLSYQNALGGGSVSTLSINASGVIGAPLDTYIFDAVCGPYFTDLHQIGTVIDDVFVVVSYAGPGNDGWAASMSIDSAGIITGVDTLEWDNFFGSLAELFRVNADVWAVVYSGPAQQGIIQTFGLETPLDQPTVVTLPATRVT